MRSRSDSLIAAAVLFAATMVIGCGGVTDPGHGDVEEAWATWVAGDLQDYRFDVAWESSWFHRSDWIRIEIAGDTFERVVGEREHWHAPIRLTIDTLWAWILEADESDELNDARFNILGVPIYANMGPWEVDGGVRYWVRRFVPTGR